MAEWIANAAILSLNMTGRRKEGLGVLTIIQHAVLATIDDFAGMIDKDKIIVCNEGKVKTWMVSNLIPTWKDEV